MTPAVKVRHPNHWTPGKFPRFPLFCPTLLLHRSPPVSLLSRSLSHPQPTLHTHAPQVCEWQSLTSPPHLVHPSVCLSNSPKWTLHTRKPAPRPSQPHPPTPHSRYFDFVLVCDPGTVGLFPPCPHLFSATGSLVPSALQPFQALFTLVTLRESLSLPQVPVARTALRKARTSPCPRCPTAPAQGYSAGCRQDSP